MANNLTQAMTSGDLIPVARITGPTAKEDILTPVFLWDAENHEGWIDGGSVSKQQGGNLNGTGLVRASGVQGFAGYDYYSLQYQQTLTGLIGSAHATAPDGQTSSRVAETVGARSGTT